jgi:osmotically-inducible protein OsmY
MWGKQLGTVAVLAAALGLTITGCERQPAQPGAQEQDEQQQAQEQDQEGTDQTFGTDVPPDQQAPQDETGTEQEQQQGTDQPMDEQPGGAAQQGLDAMAQQINQQLEAEPALQGQLEQVTVEAEGGQIVLSGNVASQDVADQIEQSAANIAGPEQIRNELTVGQQQ